MISRSRLETTTTPHRRRRGAVAAAVPVESVEARLLFSTYTVLNTADAGAGSLRQAILDANMNPGPDLIHFDIPGPGGAGGVHTIAPLSVLPELTGTTTVDG